MPLRVPMTPTDFTPEWMTAALRGSGALKRAEVVAVGQSSLGEGFGLLGSLTRLSLGYDRFEEGAPLSLVAKFPAQAEANLTLARQYRVYDRERRFYEQIAPTIATRVPRAYAIVSDGATDASILLEDLLPARVGDQLAPPSGAEVGSIVYEVARLHAAWWGKAGGLDVAWVPALDDPLWLQAGASFEVFWPAFQESFGAFVTPAIKAVGDIFAANVPAIAARLCEPPITLLHGDYRLDNIFFHEAEAEADGAAPPLTIIDWQLMSRGRGVYDIAYFMSQGVEPAARAATEMEVLHRYHESLRAGGVTGYTFDQLFDDYRTATLWCLMYPVAAGGGLDLSNERGTALATAMATRSFAAIEELGAGRIIGAG